MSVSDSDRRQLRDGRLVDCDGVQVHCIDRGNLHGKAIVFIHGLGSMIQEFACSGVFEPLQDEFRILCFDRPGYGKTGRPRGKEWTPPEQAELFSTALQKLNVGSCVVVAHSWGAMVAIALALRSPTLVKGLVLIAGYYFPEPHLLARLGSIAARPLLKGFLQFAVGPIIGRLGGAEKAVRLAFAPNEPRQRFRDEFPIGVALRPITLGTIADEAKLLEPSADALQGRYGELRCPIVIMVGDEDHITDHGLSLRLHDTLARIQPSPVLGRMPHPGTGHLLHHIHPNDVADAIRLVIDRTTISAAT